MNSTPTFVIGTVLGPSGDDVHVAFNLDAVVKIEERGDSSTIVTLDRGSGGYTVVIRGSFASVMNAVAPKGFVPDRVCQDCGCTDINACLGGCYWVRPDLCSKCGGHPFTEAGR